MGEIWIVKASGHLHAGLEISKEKSSGPGSPHHNGMPDSVATPNVDNEAVINLFRAAALGFGTLSGGPQNPTIETTSIPGWRQYTTLFDDDTPDFDASPPPGRRTTQASKQATPARGGSREIKSPQRGSRSPFISSQNSSPHAVTLPSKLSLERIADVYMEAVMDEKNDTETVNAQRFPYFNRPRDLQGNPIDSTQSPKGSLSGNQLLEKIFEGQE